MNFEITSHLTRGVRTKWLELIEAAGLVPDEKNERTLLVYDNEELVATGSRDGCVLKLIAVADTHRGEDLTALILTELRKDAFEDGHDHLFLYTKPQNRYTFESLFFYPVVETPTVLVMENKKNGLSDFLSKLPTATNAERVGAIVMNANPFTLGHRALVERASSECDAVYVFVLSEDRSEFSAKDRIEMVRRGTCDLKNVTVLETGPYLISSATFPTYFIKDRDSAEFAACDIDIKIFATKLAPRLNITHRYVGTEPTSPLTEKYNERLKSQLPMEHIEVCEIERKKSENEPISASKVREIIKKRDTGALSSLLPATTLEYLKEHKFI